MGSWFVQPETTRLELSDGQYIIVKQRLTQGERRQARARYYVPGADGEFHVNRVLFPMAMVAAFLLDWSLTDAAGMPVVIRGLSGDQLMAVLDGLDPERFDEVQTAIDAHIAAMADARAQEKKLQAGAMTDATTSSSPSAPAGPPASSVN
jgi:hypothetical protein